MKDIKLSDGSLIEIKINFLTVKLLNQTNILQLEKKIKKYENSTKEEDAFKVSKYQMEIAASVIYAILRSNGKKVDKEEALALVPADDNTMELLLKEFEERASKLKKKQIMR